MATDAEYKQQFFAKIDKTSSPHNCWLWKGRQQNGYGVVSQHNVLLGVHRVSWIIHNGPIPKGLLVCHNCPGGDNPLCANPAHLWLGTHTQNIADRDSKGRQARGDRHGTHTCPESVVRGEEHHFRKYPEKIVRGDKHGSRLRPERLSRGEKHSKIMKVVAARGERNGMNVHPEKRPRGINNGKYTKPESTLRGEQHPQSKLNDFFRNELIPELRRRGWTIKRIATKFGVTIRLIQITLKRAAAREVISNHSK